MATHVRRFDAVDDFLQTQFAYHEGTHWAGLAIRIDVATDQILSEFLLCKAHGEDLGVCAGIVFSYSSVAAFGNNLTIFYD